MIFAKIVKPTYIEGDEFGFNVRSYKESRKTKRESKINRK